MEAAKKPVLRSHSLDLGKSTKFEFAVDRNRNDSGCFDDFEPSLTGHHDPVVTYWEEAVYQWSDRARSVIAQEVVRMNELTKKSKRDLAKHEDREKVHKLWKQHMKETMDLAMDLMKCVSYDILEEFGCDPAPSEDYRKCDTPQLGKIAEEEVVQEGGKSRHGNRVYIIKVDHRIRRVKPVKRRATVKSPFSKAVPRSTRSKVNKNTMTHLLEELKELRKMVGLKKQPLKKGAEADKNLWGCQQCISNPTVWKESTAAAEAEVEAEDIFHDWVLMLKKGDVHLNSDINEVFWNISIDSALSRTRRLSEVLDDMPFGDRPDIFQDRCEILESSTRTVKRKPTQKCYWNIFSDWKFNLKETSPSLSEWKVLELKKNARNVGKKEEEEEELSQEDYFSDFRSVFDAESRHRRRSISELDEDELIIESPMKKIKQETPKSKKTLEGKSMAYKFGKAYQGMRRNLAVSMESGKKDNFDMWSSDEDIEALNQSRNEFCQLRLEMRRQRQVNRVMAEMIPQESWMEDWRWNLDEDSEFLRRRHVSEPTKETPEEIFSDWRRISLGDSSFAGQHDEYSEWMKNLKHRADKRRSIKPRVAAPPVMEMKERLTPPASKPKHIVLFIPQIPAVCNESGLDKTRKSPKHPQTGKPWFDKSSIRLMTKCHAKQPYLRGRN